MSSPESFRFDDVRLSISGGLRNVVKFLTFLWKNFMQDRVLLSAGSLAFQTLLSLVPLLAVILSVLRVSPVFDSFRLYVEEFIFENFVPASGEIARDYLWQFIDKASSVPTIGGIFLFVIALFLISTIDHTINQIWEILAPRKFFEGFTLYWTVLTLGPIFIGTSLVATSYVWYHFFMHGPLADMQTRILLTLPVLNSFLAFFSALYSCAENTCEICSRTLRGGAGDTSFRTLQEMAFILRNESCYVRTYIRRSFGHSSFVFMDIPYLGRSSYRGRVCLFPGGRENRIVIIDPTSRRARGSLCRAVGASCS